MLSSLEEVLLVPRQTAAPARCLKRGVKSQGKGEEREVVKSSFHKCFFCG